MTDMLRDASPTHWMDDMGRVCTNEFMRSDKAHGDYQLAYNMPCIKQRGKFVRLPDAEAAKRLRALEMAMEEYDAIDLPASMFYLRRRADEIMRSDAGKD